MTTEEVYSEEGSMVLVVVVASVLSAAGGAAISHILTKRHVKKQYMELLDEEIENAKVFYQKKNKVGDFASPESLAEVYSDESEGVKGDPDVDDATMAEAVRLVQDLAYSSPLGEDAEITSEIETEEVVEVKASIRRNIFDNKSEVELEFNLEEEIPNRSPNEPYILSHDEYYEGEMDYSQNSLTFHEEDEVLCDDSDVPIRNVATMIGEDNLRFGFGSKDANIVYVRNDSLEADFEIVRSFGSYAKEVLGFVDEDEGSKKPIRKFRNSD